MEVLAGMGKCVDVHVGKTVGYLEQTGELDSTFACFLSNNGAKGATDETCSIIKGSMMQHLKKYYNNNIDNLEIGDSFICITYQFSSVTDLAPTILEMVGVKHPAPTYQGREVVGMHGRSMVSYLTGKEPRIHEEDFINGWETCCRAAVRKGDCKIVFIPRHKGPERLTKGMPRFERRVKVI
ncbi:Arylsulfatase-like protein [Hapsidospora chrysogenum ATCC 11550]|uniref:Arylsulfatase-like protein n=1 Tax=Hapsidospora chrysogenum (strain ATCC 11550 / CBS 779.69 / DSM 880 / IAM 14645 / JCM 23072 / IMI 49137) TaxID=857340 RepID=A0A086TBC8_HAPC1|nr:Arylsulfatase-like protein [Hapsidospora chrysogenum ATCC 11550]